MFEDKIIEQFLGRPRAERSGEIIPKISSNDSGTERFYISSKIHWPFANSVKKTKHSIHSTTVC